jgi:HPt (histidine-containing phosphotransfer) domain-containing protein
MIDVRALERLKETVGNDPADLIEIIVSFLEEAPSLLEQMAKASDSGDMSSLQRGAHSLKSNARDFGAVSLAELCQTMEEDLRAGRDPGDVKARVDAIIAEWSKVEPALRTEIQNYQIAQ